MRWYVPGALMIYGATGYTGRLMTHGALAQGLRPLLAGRSEARLAALAGPLGLEYRVAPLTDAGALTAALRDVDVVLHAAGPFSRTATPMFEACLTTRTHYLDISGEVPVIEALARRHAEARARQIMAMPAVGFDVVPSDCLAAYVARRLPTADRLMVGVAGLAFATRGSAETIVEYAGGILVRRNGVMTTVPAGALRREFDYGAGTRSSVNITWGEAATAYYTTGIPNVDVYFQSTPTLGAILTANRYFSWMLRTAPWQAWLKASTALLPEGPSEAERAAKRMSIVVEAADPDGRRACARLTTPEAYTFTGVTGPAVAARVLHGDLETGFQTPGRVYGSEFVLGFDGVTREDLPGSPPGCRAAAGAAPEARPR